MGLLDDAIREHLDLKRRRGADPAEVARLEQEALGPVRREPAAAEPAADEHHEHHDEPYHAAHPVDDGAHAADHTHVLAPEDRHDPPHGDPLHEHPQEELGGAAAPEPQRDEHADRAQPHADRAGGVAEDDSAAPPAESPRAATGPARSHVDPDIVDQPTTEYRVEDEHHEHQHEHDDHEHHDPPTDREDVLEETPEFLQETPEHDRLWFEQRPPRDFDFDG